MSERLNNRYELSTQLGHGGFSKVWRAFDEKAKRDVAVKVFLRVGEEGVRLCREEFVRTTRLIHPNIIRLSDFGDRGGEPYLVMPFYKGGTVQDLVGKMEEKDLWRLARDIGRALHYVHNLQPAMLHNDLKPDNFLIADDGSFVLTDFGISLELAEKLSRSRDLQSTTGTGDDPDDERANGVGPRAYRAPELFPFQDLLKRGPFKATDIWAFGACLYELATGDPPFNEQGGIFQLVKSHGEKKTIRELIEPLPDHFSENFAELIYKCLEFQTWDRPRAAQIVQMADAVLDNGGTGHIFGEPAPADTGRVVEPPFFVQPPTPPVAPPPPVPMPEPARQHSPVHHRSIGKAQQGSIAQANKERRAASLWWVWPVALLVAGLAVFGIIVYLDHQKTVEQKAIFDSGMGSIPSNPGENGSGATPVSANSGSGNPAGSNPPTTQQTTDEPAPSISINIQQLNFEAPGGYSSLELETNCRWKLTKPKWLTVSQRSGAAGKFSITVNLGGHFSGYPRSGNLTFLSENGAASRAVSIYQETGKSSRPSNSIVPIKPKVEVSSECIGAPAPGTWHLIMKKDVQSEKSAKEWIDDYQTACGGWSTVWACKKGFSSYQIKIGGFSSKADLIEFQNKHKISGIVKGPNQE